MSLCVILQRVYNQLNVKEETGSAKQDIYSETCFTAAQILRKTLVIPGSKRNPIKVYSPLFLHQKNKNDINFQRHNIECQFLSLCVYITKNKSSLSK